MPRAVLLDALGMGKGSSCKRFLQQLPGTSAAATPRVLPGSCWCCRYVTAVRQHTGESGEWSLYWTAHRQPVPCRLVPVLAAWADLDVRESAADI